MNKSKNMDNYMKQHSIFLILALPLLALLMSCESRKTPDQVGEHFWLGIKTKNIALVKKYSLKSSIDKDEDLEQINEVVEVGFGKIVIDGDASEIETTVSSVLKEEKIDIKLTTYMEKHNDAWKVNFDKTLGQLAVEQNIAEVLNDIEKIKEEMTEQLQESVEEIKEKVVPEINAKVEDIQEEVIPEIKSELDKAEKQIMESLPELKDIFNDLLREIEESIKEMLPEEEEEEVKTQET